jgi:hypothetical protein
MTNIGARCSSWSRSPEVRPPAKMLERSRRPVGDQRTNAEPRTLAKEATDLVVERLLKNSASRHPIVFLPETAERIESRVTDRKQRIGVRATRNWRDGCGESFVFSELAATEPADALENRAIFPLPLRQSTRHRVPSRFDANLLKINDWHTYYPTLKKGGRPSLFLARRRATPASLATNHSALATGPNLFPLAIAESSPARAASDSLSGGII